MINHAELGTIPHEVVNALQRHATRTLAWQKLATNESRLEVTEGKPAVVPPATAIQGAAEHSFWFTKIKEEWNIP